MEPTTFDPEAAGMDNGNYFGFPFTEEQARLVLLSVPWDVTASYGGGAAFGPDAIIAASTQLDFYDPYAPDAWRAGIATAGIDYSIQDRSTMLRGDAKKIIAAQESPRKGLDELFLKRKLERVNSACEELNRQVYDAASTLLAAGKLVGLVGGDHSTPLGLIRAAAERHPGLGILHIDAHCDLREAYEGFTYSHASIMYNVLHQAPGVSKLVQVGVRDYCGSEARRAQEDGRIELFDGYRLGSDAFRGMNWEEQCDRIVAALPQTVYVSFDIDGLTPENCPSTGTPVPGGLTFPQAEWLLKRLADSGRRIAAFDLCEVVPAQGNEWDANVGARVLFRLCGQTLRSNR